MIKGTQKFTLFIARLHSMGYYPRSMLNSILRTIVFYSVLSESWDMKKVDSIFVNSLYMNSHLIALIIRQTRSQHKIKEV